MKKIGIYLEAGPACGGTYQYNRLLLDALVLLSPSQFQLMAIYGAPHFCSILAEKKITGRAIALNRFWRSLPGIWRRCQLPLTWFRAFAQLFHPLAKAMKAEKCDLWIFPSQDAYAYLMEVNALTTIHDLMHRFEGRFPEVGNPREFAWREFHYQQSCRYAKGILVDSALGKKHVEDLYNVNTQQCHVLPYIAPKDLATVTSEGFDQKFSLPKDFLFYPAQFWAHKNHANLFKALAIAKKTYPEIALVLVGSPKNAFDEVLALRQTLGLDSAVHLLGLVADNEMPEFYRRARALVMPTFFGPTNIPPLEAFALDCPVLISGIYGMPDQLGDAALYCNPDSVEDLAQKIMQIWSDQTLRAQLIAKGKIKHQEWNFTHFQAKLGNILNKILSEQVNRGEVA